MSPPAHLFGREVRERPPGNLHNDHAMDCFVEFTSFLSLLRHGLGEMRRNCPGHIECMTHGAEYDEHDLLGFDFDFWDDEMTISSLPHTANHESGG